MSFRNLFSRIRPATEQRHQFSAWPPPPAGVEVPAGRLGVQPALQQGSLSKTRPETFDPTIVVGLGPTGAYVLHEWLAQIEMGGAGPQNALRPMLLTQNPSSPLQSGIAPVWVHTVPIDSNRQEKPTTGTRETPRERVHRQFFETASFRLFRDYLTTSLRDLQRNIRVFIVASLGEPEIGLLGDVLQIFRLTHGNIHSPYRYITALVTLETPGRLLDKADTFAAMHEIGRFTYTGYHWMNPLEENRDGTVRTALLDHLFLVENRTIPELDLKLQQTEFAEGAGQVLVETLYTFTHPAASPVWENLLNDLRQGSDARLTMHATVLNTLGIATLQIPITQMDDYVAARLAQAIVYGEHPQHPDEGFVSLKDTTDFPESDLRWQARKWLAEGRGAHPVFEWLLDINNPSDLKFIPSLSLEYDVAFQTRLAHGLVEFLNNSHERVPYQESRAVLDWLAQHFLKLEDWHKNVPGVNPNAPERTEFHQLLTRWRNTVEILDRQMQAWGHALWPTSQFTERHEGEEAGSNVGPKLDTGWRTKKISPNSGNEESALEAGGVKLDTSWRRSRGVRMRNDPAFPATNDVTVQRTVANLSDYFQQRLKNAAQRLHLVGGGQIRRAITAEEGNGVKEAEDYYIQAIRPELSRFGLETSRAFRQVRDRLGWWIKLVPGRQPELLLVCLPANVSGDGEASVPPESARFTPGDLVSLGNTILALARIQAQGQSNQITGDWLQQRLQTAGWYLRRAGEPLLHYESQGAGTPYFQTRRYLLARDKSITEPLSKSVFSGVGVVGINEVGDWNPARITALSIWMNLPLSSLHVWKEAKKEFGHRQLAYLYPQEKNASEYERRLSGLQGETVLLPPDLTMTLVEQRLVTLFCQALFSGLIVQQTDDFGTNPRWQVEPLSEKFPALPLAPANDKGLWEAYKRFVLEIPLDPTQQINPNNHFHVHRREDFLNALQTEIRTRFQKLNRRELRRELENTLLRDWKRRGERDLLALAFVNLLEVELEDPVWKNW